MVLGVLKCEISTNLKNSPKSDSFKIIQSRNFRQGIFDYGKAAQRCRFSREIRGTPGKQSQPWYHLFKLVCQSKICTMYFNFVMA